MALNPRSSHIPTTSARAANDKEKTAPNASNAKRGDSQLSKRVKTKQAHATLHDRKSKSLAYHESMAPSSPHSPVRLTTEPPVGAEWLVRFMEGSAPNGP